jgi:pimeloyl-ACP methyl ester carboxylesterase
MGLGVLSVVAAVIVLAWLQPDSTILPEPTGPYGVGRVFYDWVDDRRVDPLAPAHGTKRELPVWIWYPAAPAGVDARAAYMPPKLIKALEPPRGGLLRSGVAAVFTALATDRAQVAVHAWEDAAVAPAQARFPVILLKPARGAAALQYTTLAEDLASHGYVVVGSDSPYTTFAVVYGDGRVVTRSPAGAPPETDPGHTSTLAPGQPNDLALPVIRVWVNDNQFLIDRLHVLNASGPAGRFTDRLDLDAIGAIGHSYGGAAALQFCSEDPRCKAGIDIDGAPLGEVVTRGIGKPFLFFVADRASFDAPESTLRDDERELLGAIRRISATAPAAPRLLRLRESAHYNFSDQALLSEPHLGRLVGGIGAIEPRRAFAVTRRYVRAFFDTHLKHMPDPLLQGPAAEFPEVRYPDAYRSHD